jgi:NitT/TauT family transport system substrate-binding protein
VRSTTRRNILWVLALVVALGAVGVAFVREDGSDAEVVVAPEGPTVPDDPGQGCGAAAATDPTDLRVGREVARCEAGAPEAAPLAQPATVRVVLTEPTVAAAPLLVAQATDEFEAENLTVEILEMAQPEAYAAMARGEVDAVVGTVDAPFLDAVQDGSGARLVLGGPLSRAPNDTDVAQAGLWARTDVLPDPDEWKSVEGQLLAISGGMGSGALYPVGMVLDQNELTLNAVDIVPTSSAEAARQLVGAEVSMAWLPEPDAARVAGDDAVMLLGTLPASEAVEGTVFAPRLLGADRATGLAYARAILRTVNTYLADGWSDEAVDALDEDLTGGPAPLFDWEIRADTTTRIQAALVVVGGVDYERPLEDAAVVDRSLYGDVVAGG